MHDNVMSRWDKDVRSFPGKFEKYNAYRKRIEDTYQAI